MTLDEFIDQRKGLLDDFVADYMRRRKKKSTTMIRNPAEWKQLLSEFLSIYDDQSTQDRDAA